MVFYNIDTGYERFAVALPGKYKEKAPPCFEKCNKHQLYIYPSLTADISAYSPDISMSDPAACISCALAGGQFELLCRGLPLDELLVECAGQLFEISRSEKDGKIGVICQKCKEICSNSVVFVENIEVDTYEYLLGNIAVRLIKCSDARLLREETLRLLLFREGLGGSDAAVGFSLVGNTALMKYALNTKKTRAAALCCALCTAAHLFDGGFSSELYVECTDGCMEFAPCERGIICRSHILSDSKKSSVLVD